MEKKNCKDLCEEQLFHVYVKPAPPPVVSLNERASCVCLVLMLFRSPFAWELKCVWGKKPAHSKTLQRLLDCAFESKIVFSNPHAL